MRVRNAYPVFTDPAGALAAHEFDVVDILLPAQFP